MRRSPAALACCLTLALAATISIARDARAQAPTRPAPWVLEQQTSQRWMHAAQLPAFTVFHHQRNWLVLDSIRAVPDGRHLHFTLARSAHGRDSALVVADSSGRVLRLEAGLAPFRALDGRGDSATIREDSTNSARFRRLTLHGGYLTLPQSRVWDFVVPFPSRPRVGARWMDSLRQVASDGPYRQAVTGTRVSRIVGDTALDGVRLWIVQDSARVTYEERYPDVERSLDTLVQISRTVSGVVRGTYLYDPATMLIRVRDDTAALAGEAILGYPDGRSFRTPARYERIRGWRLLDSVQYASRTEALRAQMRDQMGGLVGRRFDPDSATRQDSVRIANGDSALLYSRLAVRASSRTPPTSADDVRAMLPFMADPGRAWSLNMSRDWLYENLAQSLMEWPRAAASGADTAYTACTVAACELLGAMRATAREPRTRDVALVALFSLDPAAWSDTILALAGPEHPLLRRAAAVANGVAVGTRAAAPRIPPPNADWREWLLWMDGRDSAYRRSPAALRMRAMLRIDTAPQPRFGERHRTTIRMYSLRTGRDIVGELLREYERATNDTARQVYGTILQGLDALHLGESELADAFASGKRSRISVARKELLRQFDANASPSPDSLTAELVDHLLATIIDWRPSWRSVEPDDGWAGFTGLELHAPIQRIAIAATNLPPAVREKWAARVPIMSDDEWRRFDARRPIVLYTIGPTSRVGRFYRLRVTAAEHLERDAHQVPEAYGSGATFYLMEQGGEWVLVAWNAWVT